MQLRLVLSLMAVVAFTLNANRSEAAPFSFDFASPAPISCPLEGPGCDTGPPFTDVVGGGANPFLLNYANGAGDIINAAAWTSFDGVNIGFGVIRQDIDTIDGGLGVDNAPSDNIDAGESIALFANFNGVDTVDSFVLESVVLGNHPGAGFDPDDDLRIWWTSDDPLTVPWNDDVLAFTEVNGFLAGLGAINGIAFEALDGESTFYLSAAAGDVNSGIIPEPTTALLLALGMAGLATRRRGV